MKMDLKYMGFKGVDLAQGRYLWRIAVKTVMSLRIL
jgi:hypothetical protein